MWRACVDTYTPDFGYSQVVQVMMAREAEGICVAATRAHLRKV